MLLKEFFLVQKNGHSVFLRCIDTWKTIRRCHNIFEMVFLKKTSEMRQKCLESLTLRCFYLREPNANDGKSY